MCKIVWAYFLNLVSPLPFVITHPQGYYTKQEELELAKEPAAEEVEEEDEDKEVVVSIHEHEETI